MAPANSGETLFALTSTRRNRLLAHLGQEDQKRLFRYLESVTLAYKCPLYDARQLIDFVYFIESGVASLVITMADDAAAEVATVGNEGIVGLPVLLGQNTAPTSIYMQVPGRGLRMRVEIFREEMERSGSLRTIMLHYAHAFFNQVAQSTACAHLHSLDQRCCRWLLMTHDRMPTDEFLLTQEFMAMMLGVSREAVVMAAGKLRRAGLIRYRMGRITILDRQGLEAGACQCYAITKAEFDHFLGGAAPAKHVERAAR
jgi:CRP-like cAMP-binding protein